MLRLLRRVAKPMSNRNADKPMVIVARMPATGFRRTITVSSSGLKATTIFENIMM